MRALLKSFAERALTMSGAPFLARRSHGADTLVLAYHNIIPDGEQRGGDASLHLPQREFARQLDALVRTHDVIPLAGLGGATSGRPRAVITFDDAYAGALTAGAHELEKRNLPATIFVAPSFIGGGSFWWDRLAGPEGLAKEVRDHALTALAGRTSDVVSWREQSGIATCDPPPYQRACSMADLEAVAASGLVTFGSHTWTHPNLTCLAADEIEDELARPLEWLRARFSNTLPYLAYPYGLHNGLAQRIAANVGYQAAFLVEGGWLTRAATTTSPYELPRWNVPAGISLRGFELRTSGVL